MADRTTARTSKTTKKSSRTPTKDIPQREVLTCRSQNGRFEMQCEIKQSMECAEAMQGMEDVLEEKEKAERSDPSDDR